MDNYKAVTYLGWSKSAYYYTREDWARHVCECTLERGGRYELYKRTENGWELIETKGE